MPRRNPPKPSAPTPRASPPQLTVFDCEADILEGLEPLGPAELSQQLKRYVTISTRPVAGKLSFRYTGDLRMLLELRSVLAVYLVKRFAVPTAKAVLGHQHLTALLEQIATARALFPADAYRTLRLGAAGETPR